MSNMNSDSVTFTVTTTISSGGFYCPYCGKFVSWGTFHDCQNTKTIPLPDYQPLTPIPFDADLGKRYAELLMMVVELERRVTKLTERIRLLESK